MNSNIGDLGHTFDWDNLESYDKFTWNRESGSIIIYAYRYLKEYTSVAPVIRIWPDPEKNDPNDSKMVKVWEILNTNDRNVLILESRNEYSGIRDLVRLKLSIKKTIDILDEEHKVFVHKYIDHVVGLFQ